MVLDFETPKTVAAAFKGIDTRFLVTPGSPYAARQEERLLAEAKKVGVGRLVKLSGKIAEHHPVGSAYGNTEAERQIKSSGIPYAPRLYLKCVAIGMSVWRARQSRLVATYGSARWADPVIFARLALHNPLAYF